MFTPKIKDWKEITYTDDSVIKRKDDESPPLSGLSVYKLGRAISPPSQLLQLHVKPKAIGLLIPSPKQNLWVFLWHSVKSKPMLPRI
eukprot:137068-Pelagomonas_calceolata.AAC.1